MKDWCRELFKRFWRRVPVWAGLLTALILLDEYIKEGYLFQPADVLTFGTHENMLLMLALLLLGLSLIKLKSEDRLKKSR